MLVVSVPVTLSVWPAATVKLVFAARRFRLEAEMTELLLAATAEPSSRIQEPQFVLGVPLASSPPLRMKLCPRNVMAAVFPVVALPPLFSVIVPVPSVSIA